MIPAPRLRCAPEPRPLADFAAPGVVDDGRRMGSVRKPRGSAWIAHGCGCCLVPRGSLSTGLVFGPVPRDAKERFVLDLLYIGLTIVVFAALWLLIRGVERFER